jgi:hypothetical protein
MLVGTKRDSRKIKNIKRAGLLKKHNIEKKENLDQMNEELKQKFQQRFRDCLGTRKDKPILPK